jgi:endonuclease-3 related protein
VKSNYNGSIEKMLSKPRGELRAELLSIHGIGNETADSILLYASGKPSFVIDAYTLRFIGRFYGMKPKNYVEAKVFFERSMPKDTRIYGEFHALLVELGKNYCKKSAPYCEKCPLLRSCRFPSGK